MHLRKETHVQAARDWAKDCVYKFIPVLLGARILRAKVIRHIMLHYHDPEVKNPYWKNFLELKASVLNYKVNLIERYGTLSLSSQGLFLVTCHQYTPSIYTLNIQISWTSIKKCLSSDNWVDRQLPAGCPVFLKFIFKLSLKMSSILTSYYSFK